jgi:RHS repeat-associated protein
MSSSHTGSRNYERDLNASDEAMFRRYNRWWSRFDQPDPSDSSYNFTNPQSFNRYAYTNNDPVNHIDPLGLDPEGGVVGAWLAFQIGQNFDVNVPFNRVIDTIGDGGDVIAALPPLGRLIPITLS